MSEQPEQSPQLSRLRRNTVGVLSLLGAMFILKTTVMHMLGGGFDEDAMAALLVGSLYTVLGIGLLRAAHFAPPLGLGFCATVMGLVGFAHVFGNPPTEAYVIAGAHGLGALLLMHRAMWRDRLAWSRMAIGAAIPLVIGVGCIASGDMDATYRYAGDMGGAVTTTGVIGSLMGGIGFLGALRGRTWGVLLALLSGIVLFVQGALSYLAENAEVAALSVLGGMALCAVFVPISGAIYRFLRAPA